MIINSGFKMQKKTIRNKSLIAASTVCACMSCQKTFNPTKILKWVDNYETALCPMCGVDAVIGYDKPLSKEEKKELSELHTIWFTPLFDE